MTQETGRVGALTLLLVDDDEVLRERLGRALRERGFEVTTAAGRGGGDRHRTPRRPRVRRRRPAHARGIRHRGARRAPAIDPATRVLMLTGYGSIATAVEATRRGAVGYLPKPADADEIVAALTGQAGPEAGAEFETPSLARAEWEHIQRVLQDCDGNVSETARRLGIHRRSLQRKLQKYPPTR